MNLLAHIITRSPPSMNLRAHGATSLDPSLASQHDNKNKKSSWLQRYRLRRPPGRTPLSPGVRLHSDPLSQGLSSGG
ncbi:hypothetical protein DEO72_LG2g3689 [Vigna unguiculata]|uniref:Uncharacterized protein n=1 Tax=Vigna unguiculata TaxID=3917 RepID=A0A4D6L4G1_VIGUN|nr:hypothetical protein DEO72_LG2g3689 [Vigna unguiculata]